MGFDRTSRLSEEIRKIVSNIIQNELKDPRIPMLTSITHVDVTKDLRYAKVYVSVLGDADKKEKCIEGLKSASGYIRKEVGSKLKARYIPEMVFEIDKSIEHGMHISNILKEINHDDTK
ncbi:ribosome-binding factor A [Caloramator quimbayensis]|uniref:Ribosome-binding factor A n=1 Tax=Caloramator quimbayensis TaxID=1147123 RepID=A0A1T4XCW7_9CLOT|nr:30S ribosome-binding factor RbfA [Caloramator quimbayensis]SKA86988.1 ribosome-binding factor A [Caloramator quimbayensis]